MTTYIYIIFLPVWQVTADSGGKRSECGIGALMPWNDHLYLVSYLSVPDGGNGTGLYRIDANLNVGKSVDNINLKDILEDQLF